MDKLTEEFRRSLVNDTKETLMDYMELGIDSFIDDGILKEVPIINSIVSVLKVSKNIYDRNLLKQTLIFINEFNSGKLEERSEERRVGKECS